MINGWQSFNNTLTKQLNSYWDDLYFRRDVSFPKSCPACSASALHIYFHVHNLKSRRGGGWIWCSSCRAFDHCSADIPIWWSNLVQIEEAQLTAVPGYLDKFAMEIDQHWATFGRSLRLSQDG